MIKYVKYQKEEDCDQLTIQKKIYLSAGVELNPPQNCITGNICSEKF